MINGVWVVDPDTGKVRPGVRKDGKVEFTDKPQAKPKPKGK